ncbi:MAG: tyrosine-type recombinase/integrase [Candidatus Jettenia sp. CY-1]|nr:MAG: tyrosine-type recombinase/integrase [Candidatus Jettenia sp. CY-1]
MAVRFRKYFQQCKPIPCNGRPGKSYCPGDRPKRSNGEYKTCGVWCIEFFDDNKEWQSLTFKDIRNKTDAEKRLVLFISDRERGQLNLPKRKAVPTLTEYSKTYLELHKAAKENTLAMKKRAVNVLVEYLGDYGLDKITPFIVEKFRTQRKEQGQVKDSVINIDTAILTHMFNTAIQAGIIDKNPCQKVKRLRVSQVKDRILSSSEIATILSMPHGKDKLMILVGLFTGARLNEVLSLKWSDLDFNKGIIHITQSKTGKVITIPLSRYLIDELTQYKTISNGDRVFEDAGITNNIVSSYSAHFSNLFKGMGIHNFTFHNLRHTFSSLLQSELGIGAVVVQGMTGHTSLSMLQKYSHSGLDSRQRAIQALTDHVLNADKNTSKVVSL